MYVRASNFISENAISTTYGIIMMSNETKKVRKKKEGSGKSTPPGWPTITRY